MTDPQITQDDIARWFKGAAIAVAALLPDNEDGERAFHHANMLALHARRSLDAAGVPRELDQ